MSSDSDSSEDEEQIKRLKESVAPVSCLPINKSVNSEHEGSLTSQREGVLTQSSNERLQKNLPSLRKKIYDDNATNDQCALKLDAGAKERIAKALGKSLQSVIEEGNIFRVGQNTYEDSDEGVRLFKKSTIVISGACNLPVSNPTIAGKKKRKVSSSSSDSEDDAAMAALASVAVSADSIRQNCLIDHMTPSTNQKAGLNHMNISTNEDTEPDHVTDKTNQDCKSEAISSNQNNGTTNHMTESDHVIVSDKNNHKRKKKKKSKQNIDESVNEME